MLAALVARILRRAGDGSSGGVKQDLEVRSIARGALDDRLQRCVCVERHDKEQGALRVARPPAVRPELSEKEELSGVLVLAVRSPVGAA